MASDESISKASMAEIGSQLKRSRERLSLTIDQAQKKTHIQTSIILALEEGNCDSVLSPAYVKGFLKKYAESLGMDPKDMLKTYNALHPETSFVNLRPAQTPPPKKDMSGLLTLLKFFIIIIVALVSANFAFHKITGIFKNRTIPHKVIQPKKQVQTKAANSVPVTPKVSIPRDVPLNLVIKAKENVFVKVKKDGLLLYEKFLSKGTSEAVTADNSIVLYVGKAEAMDLSLNGKSLGPQGRGVIKSLEITRNGVRLR